MHKRRDITTNCEPGDLIPPNRVNTTERLQALRQQMALQSLSAYIVPLDEEGRLKWISGFSGSNGKAIITADKVSSKQRFVHTCCKAFFK